MVTQIGCPPLSPFGLGSTILFTDLLLIFSFFFSNYFRFFYLIFTALHGLATHVE
jgi:hypothetical protein